MHNAPPVVAPVGRFVWAVPIWTGWIVVGVAGWVIWLQLALPSVARALTVTALMMLAWGFAWGCGIQEQLACGQLVWSGENWCWRNEGQDDMSVQLTKVVDWNSGMLVALKCQDEPRVGWTRTRYAYLTRQEMPRQWHGFRCAVYSRPKADTRINRSLIA